MKGKWKVYNMNIGDTKQYIAGRQLDLSKPLHGGNIEYAGEYAENREAVAIVCEELNSEVHEKDLSPASKTGQ